MTTTYYTITNGLYWLSNRSGQWSPVSKRELAKTWDTEDHAKKQLSIIPKVLRGRGYRVEPVEAEVVPTAVSVPQTATIKECGIKEVEAMFGELSGAVKTLSSLKDMCIVAQNGLAEQNKLQEDLLHKIEFMSGAKGQAAHMFAELQMCRRKRRHYKDLIDLCNTLSTMSKIPPDYIEKWQAGIAKRKYMPRSNENVF